MIYLDRARIFRRFRFSLRIRFLRHLALMVQIRAEMNLKKLNYNVTVPQMLKQECLPSLRTTFDDN
jgi:hypothetical protein